MYQPGFAVYITLGFTYERTETQWGKRLMEDVFLKNPWLRALLPLVLMGIVGVTSSSLVVEIATGNDIQWSLVPKKVSFYILLMSTIASAFYQIKIQRYDRELAKGFTPKQYEAAIRNRVAEEVAKRSMKLIRDGHIDQLEKETETFKKLYGEITE
jgi:hypothetical protein